MYVFSTIPAVSLIKNLKDWQTELEPKLLVLVSTQVLIFHMILIAHTFTHIYIYIYIYNIYYNSQIIKMFYYDRQSKCLIFYICDFLIV